MLDDLQPRLQDVLLKDQPRLQRRLNRAHALPQRGKREAALARIESDMAVAEERVIARRDAVPTITYPAALPISSRKDDILAAIRDHQVVIVAGETGSGKTTQLPKICLELGRGIRGAIGHTQPRRLAAHAVADRVSEELGTDVGDVVGYKVRFTDRSSDNTLVKVMTDGILLAEIQQDRMLRQYDTLIIDEAHERSLNIDFLLGYVKQLLPRRPDLKVVITSATIDPQRFSKHFDDAPVLEVSGRMFPVEVRYRPLSDNPAEQTDDDGDDTSAISDRDPMQAIQDAVSELCAQGSGDILVFLSGEREIRDVADSLRATMPATTEILPLYARLSSAEQHRVFAPHQGRRIVLATNVAETSLTVPGIRYVVDPGTARISRYSSRLKVQRLPIERVPQASADQRKGRCGRLQDGICIRLYSEDDYLSRPRFTDPEILRTNLASVILQMTALGIGDVASFPFLDAPDRRQVRDGEQLLHELGALDTAQADVRNRLTELGRKLARLPIDPRLGRMVLEADRNGCVPEVLVIAAALSIQDPRERPYDKQQAADDKHRRFADPQSDFVTYLNLWSYLQEQQRELSSSQFHKMCRTEFLHYLRIREWQDLYAQLRRAATDLGLSVGHPAAEPDVRGIHISLLSGLLSHIGMWDVAKREYVGARGARFAVWPGSALSKKRPRWVMAGELVETSRLWGRDLARIEPEWVEPLAPQLVQRSYSEPHWERHRGAVVAVEKVVLYGLPIVASRKVTYGRIDPQLSRELFIRHALVERDWETRHEFFAANRALLEDVGELEHRARRRDIVVDEDVLFDFYNRRIGADVVSARHFDSWWKQTRRTQPDLLTLSRDILLTKAASDVTEDDYPGVWPHGGLGLAVTYRFEPGAPDDGATVHVPLPLLNQVSADEFDWHVPGMREELVTALLRSLPKHLRRGLVPVTDTARAVVDRLQPYDAPLLDALACALRQLRGVVVPRDPWDMDRVPPHLRLTVRVVDSDGGTLAAGKDVAMLQHQLAAPVRHVLSETAYDIERSGLRTWSVGTLPCTFQAARNGTELTGYPALVDEGDSVAVRVLSTPADQRVAMRAGTRRLLLLNLPAPLKPLLAQLDNRTKLVLGRNPYPSVPALLDDAVTAAVDELVAQAGGPAWDAEGFARLHMLVRAELPGTLYRVVIAAASALDVAQSVEDRLSSVSTAAAPAAVSDMRAQLSRLVSPGFLSATGLARLLDLPRYLQAIERRLQSSGRDPHRDSERMQSIEYVQHAYDRLLDRLPVVDRDDDRVHEIRWLIEELRVSYFAQTLGTATRVSEQRILRAIDSLSA